MDQAKIRVPMTYKTLFFLLLGLPLMPLSSFAQCGNLTPPDPCLVTVDSNGNNVVVWEENEGPLIEEFVCYRDFGGNFEEVGRVSNDSLSTWVDMDPDKGDSARYLLTKMDTCGNESDFGTYHRVMFLTVALNNNLCPKLVWSPYVGFTPIGGVVMRDTTGTGENFTVIDSIGPNQTTYTDLDMCAPCPDSVSYLVKVFPPDTCQASRAQNFNSSRSNRRNIANPTSISERSRTGFRELQVFPVQGQEGVYKVTLPKKRTSFQYRVYTITGRTLESGTLTPSGKGTHTLDMSHQPRGLYFVELFGERNRWRSKFLRE